MILAREKPFQNWYPHHQQEQLPTQMGSELPYSSFCPIYQFTSSLSIEYVCIFLRHCKFPSSDAEKSP